jgi:PAS domain S-box-containing protein
MKPLAARDLWSAAAQVVLGAAAVLLVTAVCYRLRLNIAMAVLGHLFVILLLSLKGSFISAALVSVIAVLCLGYFFVAPKLSIAVTDPLDLTALIVFLTISLVISRLVTRVRHSLSQVQAANDELREQARLLDLTHDTIFVRDLDGVIRYWNRGAEELYGWRREEALGQVTHQLLHTVFPVPLEAITEELFRTGRWEGELRHTRRNGAELFVASRWSLQRDEYGLPAGILETNNDITERKRAEEALRRSESYLAEAQRLSHTGSWARSLRRPEDSYWSAEGYRMFQVDPAGPPARVVHEMRERIHPDDRPRLKEAAEQAIRDKADFEVNYRALMPDGSVRYIHTVGQPVTDAAGEVTELVGTVIDVTERKRTERALRRARERTLEARFAAVLAERTRLAREIHDTLLQGFTGVALKLLAASNRVTEPAESVMELREIVSLAQKTLVDARRAVWDLRAPSSAPGDFPAMVRLATEDCVRGTELRLEYYCSGLARPLDPEVEAVAIRVLQEALANVVKHAGARTARVDLAFHASRVQLAIADDGRGFTVDPEFQTYGGHWGLLGMRERTSQVRGKLSIRSSPGRGSQIVLRVPYEVPRAAITPPPPAMEPA